MKKQLSNDQFSESLSTKESERIYPFCISLVSSSIKELENEWNKAINNNNSKKKIIQSLFSLLNYQILLIQQISKYYNLYIYNSDEDNLKLIKQIININKELMSKKISTIISVNSCSKEKKEKIYEENILNYKISKFNQNIKNGNNNKIKNNANSYGINKIINNNNKNAFNKKSEYNKTKHKVKENGNIEEINNGSIVSSQNKNFEKKITKNKLNLNDILINNNLNSLNTKRTVNSKEIKRKNNKKKDLQIKTPKSIKTVIESPKYDKIRINLANRFLKNNNNENNEFATLSTLSHQSKKSIYNNLCLTQSTYNPKKMSNAYTIPADENPVRKVKNIILNAKNSLLLIKTNNTPTNMRIFNRNRYTTYDNNRKYILSEINKDYSSKDKDDMTQNKNKILSLSNSSKNFYDYSNVNNYQKGITKSMSDQNILVSMEIRNKYRERKNNDNIYNNNKINKERKCHQILKDGMKKIEKRLNSKGAKKGLYKTKSKDYLSLIKKITYKKSFK